MTCSSLCTACNLRNYNSNREIQIALPLRKIHMLPHVGTTCVHMCSHVEFNMKPHENTCVNMLLSGDHMWTHVINMLDVPNTHVLTRRFQHVDSHMLETTGWKQHVNPTCRKKHVDFHMLLTTCWLTCCFQHVGVNMSFPTCLWQLVEGNMLVQIYWMQRAVCVPICWKPHYYLHHVRNDTWSIVYTILITWCWKQQVRATCYNMLETAYCVQRNYDNIL